MCCNVGLLLLCVRDVRGLGGLRGDEQVRAQADKVIASKPLDSLPPCAVPRSITRL